MTNVNIGSAPNDGTGDVLSTAFNKINTNFNEVTVSIDDLESADSAQDADIIDIFDTLDNNEGRITDLESDLTSVTATLGSKVSQTLFNQTIANLNLTIASLNERILALENL